MAEEQIHVEGYVDRMKMKILDQRRKASGRFSQRVREIVGIDKVKVWEEVEENLKHSSRKVPVDITVLEPRKDLVVDKVDFSNISQLLERKAQKAEHGHTMVEEIRVLLQGCKKLKYF